MALRIRPICGAAIAAALIAATIATPADAARRGWRGNGNAGAAVAAGVIGAAAGAIALSAARPQYAPDPYYNGPVEYYEPAYADPAPVYTYDAPAYYYDQQPVRRLNNGNYWLQRERDQRDRLGY